MRKRPIALGAGTVLLALMMRVSPLHAQGSTATDDGPARSITLNPFFLLLGWVSAEYEQRINASIAFVGGVSYLKFDDEHYANAEVKARLYPSEHALKGYNMAASFGMTRLRVHADEQICVTPVPSGTPPCSDQNVWNSATVPAIGIEAGYQWLLGTHRRTAVSLGIGGKRFLASKSTLLGTDRVIPTWRMGVGYTF